MFFTATSSGLPTQEIRRHDTIRWDGPKHPYYSRHSVRMLSFSTWPSNANQQAEKLSKGGFFYIGKSFHK